MRADSAAAGLERVRANLVAYGVDPTAAGGRVVPVPGDLEQRLLGLEPARFDELAAQIGDIYHCGAVVKWTYPYRSLRRANVGGTREVLRLAAAGGARLHHVSTVGVFASASSGGRVVAEDDDLESSGPLAAATRSRNGWPSTWCGAQRHSGSR